MFYHFLLFQDHLRQGPNFDPVKYLKEGSISLYRIKSEFSINLKADQK